MIAKAISYTILLGCFALLSLSIAWAADQPTAASPTIVNLELKDVPISMAFDSLFKGSGLRYTIRPGVTGKVVELKLKSVTFEQALDALVEAGNLTYKLEGEVYVIGPAKPRPAPEVTATDTTPQPEPAQTLGEQVGAGPQPNAGQSGTQKETEPAPPPPPVVPQVIVNQEASPVYYGQPQEPSYGPYGYGGGPPVYTYGNVSILGGYPPVVVAGGNPYVFLHGRRVPPPPGYVSPDIQRFLQTQFAIRSRYYFSYPGSFPY